LVVKGPTNPNFEVKNDTSTTICDDRLRQKFVAALALDFMLELNVINSAFHACRQLPPYDI